MSRYIPQAYKKARKEVCKKKNETKNFSKYQVMQHILDKNWSERNKQQPELLLSGIDEQMIFNCMEHYFHLYIKSDEDMLKEFCNFLEEEGYLDTNWYCEYIGIVNEFLDKSKEDRHGYNV